VTPGVARPVCRSKNGHLRWLDVIASISCLPHLCDPAVETGLAGRGSEHRMPCVSHPLRNGHRPELAGQLLKWGTSATTIATAVVAEELGGGTFRLQQHPVCAADRPLELGGRITRWQHTRVTFTSASCSCRGNHREVDRPERLLAVSDPRRQADDAQPHHPDRPRRRSRR
jgi:hypothetical protein